MLRRKRVLTFRDIHTTQLAKQVPASSQHCDVYVVRYPPNTSVLMWRFLPTRAKTTPAFLWLFFIAILFDCFFHHDMFLLARYHDIVDLNLTQHATLETL